MNRKTEDCLLVLTRHMLRAVCASPDTPGRGADFELRISRFAPKPGACTLRHPGLFSGGFQNAVRFFRGVRMNHWTRRKFFLTTLSASVAAGARNLFGRTVTGDNTLLALPGGKNIIICARNGLNYIDAGYERLRAGADTLDAAITAVSGPETDPNDDSVGLGGLPNEEGVVELDACCMHGPTRRAGAVGAVHDIKNVAALAITVMEHTGHVMLAGERATRFGLKLGFPKENLLTQHSRKIWQLWKESNSNQDWWGPGMADPNWKPPAPLQISPISDQPEHVRRLYGLAADIGFPPEARAG